MRLWVWLWVWAAVAWLIVAAIGVYGIRRLLDDGSPS